MTCKDTTTPSIDTETAPQSCGGDTKPAFTYHQDPGHGWLEVPAADIAANGLTEAAFSRFSYVDRRRHVFYLEEDCDLPLFALAYGNRHFKRPPITEVHHDGDCFVRGLERVAS